MASPFIDDAAPAGQKTRWLAIFFLTVPVGVATGFILGKVMGDPLGWRAPFLLCSALMVPFVAFCLRTEPLSLRGTKAPPAPEAGSGADAAPQAQVQQQRDWRALGRSFWADVRLLLRMPLFVTACAALSAHTATVGCLSYYGPKAAKEIFSLDSADTVFGALTVLTGILGTLTGGIVLDKWHASVPAALQFCAIACLLAFILLLAALQAPRLRAFIPLFACGELALFSINACVSAAIMWSVPLRLRGLAMSMTTITMHVFGDVPAPPLVGRLQDSLRARRGDLPNNWRVSLGVVTGTLALSAVLFQISTGVARRGGAAGASRRAEEDGADDDDGARGGDDVPLLLRGADAER